MVFNGKNKFFIENMIRYLFLIHGCTGSSCMIKFSFIKQAVKNI